MTRTGSAAGAIGPSIDHVKTMLFRPFDIGRWFTLGFVTFLAYLAEGGVGNFGNSFRGNPWNGGSQDAEALETLREGANWMAAHQALIAVILFTLILFVLLFSVLVQWLQSRGTFMYIDCVATDRAEVVRPWREHRDLADSFFFWRLIFMLVVMFVGIVLAIPLLVSLFSAFRSGDLGFEQVFGTAVVLLTVPLLVILAIASVLIQVTLRDFVAPVMYLRRIRCSEAFGIVLSMMRASPGAFLIYFLLKIVFVMVVAVATIVFGCLTCCIGFCCIGLPYIGRVVLQPVFVFNRSFSLFFLQGFGPEFDVFGPDAPGGGLPRVPPPPPFSPAPSGGPAGWPSSPASSGPGVGPTAAVDPSGGWRPPEPPASIPVSDWPEAPAAAPGAAGPEPPAPRTAPEPPGTGRPGEGGPADPQKDPGPGEGSR